jgi:hypothetical protein
MRDGTGAELVGGRYHGDGQSPGPQVDGVRELIEVARPGSSTFDPIRRTMAFAKLKALLRKAAARTRDALWDKIGDALRAFTPQECENYFKHVGYAPL